jgi:hypothetical protein
MITASQVPVPSGPAVTLTTIPPGAQVTLTVPGGTIYVGGSGVTAAAGAPVHRVRAPARQPGHRHHLAPVRDRRGRHARLRHHHRNGGMTRARTPAHRTHRRRHLEPAGFP